MKCLFSSAIIFMSLMSFCAFAEKNICGTEATKCSQIKVAADSKACMDALPSKCKDAQKNFMAAFDSCKPALIGPCKNAKPNEINTCLLKNGNADCKKSLKDNTKQCPPNTCPKFSRNIEADKVYECNENYIKANPKC